MSKKKIQITIPEPCHKKFEEMIPARGGNFCDSCEKVVMDFTNKTDQEIANVFIKNKGKICGQFRKNQLDRNIDLTSSSVNSYRGKAASILLTGILTAGAGNAQNNITAPQVIENQQFNNKKPQTNKLKEEENTSADQSKQFNFLIIDNTGETLIGASIILKEDENIKTTSNIDGTAALTIPSSYLAKNSFTIAVSYTGFTTQETTISKNQFDSNQVFEVILSEGIMMGAMVVIGYSEARPSTLYQIIKNWFYRIKYNREERKEKRANRKAAKQLKKEKKKAHHKIIQLPTQQFSISVKNIFPNPFSDEINLEIHSAVKDDIQISLFNISGQKIYQVTQGVIEGNQNISLNLKNIKLEDGSYILHLKEKNGQVQSRKVIRFSNK